jgi:putative oxidoreductase
MSGQHAVSTSMKAWSHSIRGLRLLLGFIFVGSAVANVVGMPAIVIEFDRIGLGNGFRYTTAFLQCTGALLLYVPSMTLIGDAILLSIGVGAGWAQLAALDGDIAHVAALLLVIAAVTAWDVRALLNSSSGTTQC